MKKAKLEKLKREVKNKNRRVQRENAAFASLSPAEKRMHIARDVISQLRTKRLIATPGIWLAGADGGDLMQEGEALQKKDVELQKVLKSQMECTGCALGGMFMCAVETANKIKVKDLIDFYHPTKEEIQDGDNGPSISEIDGDDAFTYLRRFFTANQLELIESAFERGGGAHGDEAASFAADVEEAEDRMRLIMENIIVNKGRFLPEKQPELTWRTPGYLE